MARHEYASLLHRELGRRDAALDEYRAMLAIEPGSTEAIVGMAVIATLRGDTREAERLYLEIADEEPVALVNLGLLYRDDLGRKAEALACFRRYLAFDGPRAADRSATDRIFVVPNYVAELEAELEGQKP
jgi:tetratricopeptide (TPR) repeat protein